MNEFTISKFAALEDLAGLIDDGASINDCTEAIRATLDVELDKEASQEEITHRLGVEAACYDFLKEASEYYGTYEVQDEAAALLSIIEKVAAGSAAFGPGMPGDVMGNPATVLGSHHPVNQPAQRVARAKGSARQAIFKAKEYAKANKGKVGAGAAAGALGVAGLGYLGHKALKKDNKKKD